MADVNGLMMIGVTLAGGLALLNADFAEPDPAPAPQVAMADAGAARPIHAERGADGRQYLWVKVNDRSVRFLIDTAANRTVLSARDAAYAGIRPEGVRSLRTVGGTVAAAHGTAETLSVDGEVLSDVDMLILENHDQSLLGMDMLDRLEGRYLHL